MVWFSTDNGPHTLADSASLNPQAAARSGGQLAATNGLRQCKASVFEGGIRVPGFIAWPQALGSAHKRTAHVSSSLDFMATVNEILGLAYPKPAWAVDSKSLLPLIDGREALDSPRGKPIGWQYVVLRCALTRQTALFCVCANVCEQCAALCSSLHDRYRSICSCMLYAL